MTQNKALTEMTLEELWALFPIVLSPHRPQWKKWAEEEMAAVAKVLASYSPRLNHIGSTAIPSIQAKPIIDLLVELPPDFDRPHVRTTMERSGYICMSASDSRLSFNKGYTPEGFAEKVFHIHIHVLGDHDEIYFRDYLRANPAVAREYESLKSSLLPEYRQNRDGYTEAKSAFVKRVTELAKRHRSACTPDAV